MTARITALPSQRLSLVLDGIKARKPPTCFAWVSHSEAVNTQPSLRLAQHLQIVLEVA